MKIFIATLFLLIVICYPEGTFAQDKRTFPFTAQQDSDGARFVWFIYQQAGLQYDYVKADSLPSLNCFRPAPNNKPQAFDVAWWKDFVAIYDSTMPSDSNLVTAQKYISLKKMQKKHGAVKFYRFWRKKKLE